MMLDLHQPSLTPPAETLGDILRTADLGFGTSGLRGRADKISDRVAFGASGAFLKHIGSPPGTRVAVAGDLRPSTPRLIRATIHGALANECLPVYCGLIPSPALALYCFSEHIPGFTVTASHNPIEENGLKMTRPACEMTKADEGPVKGQVPRLPAGLFNPDGSFLVPPYDLAASNEALSLYIQRYLTAFPRHLLAGLRIGVYGHSAVGRDIMADLYERLGAEVVRLGWSGGFVSVDTEAIDPRDVELGRLWASQYKLDAILSADGDSDRPLISDESGKWIRGDVAGILTAKFIGAEAIATPVSTNTAAERSGWFRTCRTRIGSPYVIEGMDTELAAGARVVAGYEGNGGFLLATAVDIRERFVRLGGPRSAALAEQIDEGFFCALPTRDAITVHLALLSLSVLQAKPLSSLLSQLPRRFTSSNRIKGFPRQIAGRIVSDMIHNKSHPYCREISDVFGAPISDSNTVDGLRLISNQDETLHLRASGNADDFRCYSEAASEERAFELCEAALRRMEQWK